MFCPAQGGGLDAEGQAMFCLGAGGPQMRRAGTCCAPAQGGPKCGGPGHVLPQRRGDPNAEGQDAFCPSSAGWPPFMRVNPVLDWGYGDVWALLRAARLPYCALYDRGFTSIGSVANTRPNRCARPARTLVLECKAPLAHRFTGGPPAAQRAQAPPSKLRLQLVTRSPQVCKQAVRHYGQMDRSVLWGRPS